MTAPRGTPPGFDLDAAAYDEQLGRGLALSGEDREFFARGRVDLLCRLWERRGWPAPRCILDWGCGTGDGTGVLAERFAAALVIGVDPSATAIEHASRRFGSTRVRFVRLEPDRSPALAPADLVHLSGVLHHVPVAERARFLDALAGRLAPGGVVSLFENNPLNPGTHWVMARIPFDRDARKVPSWEARRRLREAGLRPERARFLFVFPRPLARLRPLERALERIPLGAQYCVVATRGR